MVEINGLPSGNSGCFKPYKWSYHLPLNVMDVDWGRVPRGVELGDVDIAGWKMGPFEDVFLTEN